MTEKARKRARGTHTRQHILEIATRLLADEGYAAVSIETVLRETGLSRGALYHHFRGKEALFTAVLEAVEARVAGVVAAAAASARSPQEALRAGCEAWFRLAASDRAVRQIVLRDAPSVVGWEAWREIDGRNALGLLKAGLAAAASAKGLPADHVEADAHILLAVLIEAAMLIARSDDEGLSARSRAAVESILTCLMDQKT